MLLKGQPWIVCFILISIRILLAKSQTSISLLIFCSLSVIPKLLKPSISRNLRIKLGQFPFTYLGIPISTKKLLVNQFNSLPIRVKITIQSWNHSSISLAGSVVFLNRIIFSTILNYLLSVIHLPNTTLDAISKLAQDFL